MANIQIDALRSFWGAGRYLDVPHLVLDISFDKSLADRKPFRKCVLALAKYLDSTPSELLSKSLTSGSPSSIFGLLVISMQQYAGHAVSAFSAHDTGKGTASVAVEQQWPLVAELAGRFSVFLMDYIFGDIVWSTEELRFQLNKYLELCAKGPNVDTRYLYGEAKQAGIPVAYTSANGLQFGQGFRIRHMLRKLTDRTSPLAVTKTSNKTRTIEILKQAGLPTPAHIEVGDAIEAVRAATKIGFPVVVKPVGTDRGVGITVGITTENAVKNAYELASRFDQNVAVESFVPGDTYRLLVIDGKFAAASRTEPTAITGDGKSSVRQIVERINNTQQRGPGHQKALTWLALDEEAMTILQSLNLAAESILDVGQTIRLRTTSNLSRGGVSVAVTDEVHKEVRRLAELCSSVIGLEIAGIDYRTTSISQPWQELESAIIEINHSPGLRMHYAPAVGKPVNVGSAVLKMLYPEVAKSRIPIVAVTGTNGKTTTTRLIAHILTRCGMVTARITTDEMAVAEHIIVRDDCAGAGFARRVLAMPNVEAAALEVARGGSIKYGLGFERCDVAVVTNIQSDHVGELGVDSLDELTDIKQIVVNSADAAVVLNGDDEHCLRMATSVQNSKVVFFSLTTENPEMLSHVAKGGVAFFLKRKAKEQWICRAEANRLTEIVNVNELPITYKGLARHNIQNAMAAIAATEQSGIDMKDIIAAVREFESTAEFNYGRLNFIDELPFTLIVDYAHNKDAYEMFCAFMQGLGISGRKICAFGLNGARRSDATAIDTVKTLVPNFDLFAPFTWNSGRRRRAGFSEVLSQGLISAGVKQESISAYENEGDAIQFAFSAASRGDLVAILGGVKEHVLKEQIELYKSGLSAGGA